MKQTTPPKSKTKTVNKRKKATTKTSKAKFKPSDRDKILIIAEKPSVARDILKCLDDNLVEVEKGYWEGQSYIVSYAVGHLLTIAKPAEIDARYKGGWSLNVLPMIPARYPLEPIPSGKAQLAILKKIIKRPDVVEIVNACDAGREGELIFRYILDYVMATSKTKTGTKPKKISRLWLQSMTERGIRKALSQLRSDTEMKNLEAAARSRSEADWLIGMNSSRGLTAFNSRNGGFQITPSGRVQTPTLSMIVTREELIKQFIPHDYFTLEATFYDSAKATPDQNEKIDAIAVSGKWIDENFKKDPKDKFNEKRRDRISSEETAQAIVKKCSGQIAIFSETKRKASERAPSLYDLTSLQREANSRFGFSAKATLGLAQALYEKHKLTTYPRTNSRHLPSDYVETIQRTFSEITKSKYETIDHLKPFIAHAQLKGLLKHTPRIFDDKKVSDHHAIIPTRKAAGKLSEPEVKLYLMIVQRTLAAFFPAAEYEKVDRRFEVLGEVFVNEGRVLVKPGWREIYGKTAEGKFTQPLDASAKVLCHHVELSKGTTTPPARYSEATLLGAMESAGKNIEDEALAEAMRERGLGTPATRAAIIEKLISDKYVVKEARELIPTTKAHELFTIIRAMKILELSSPELTGNWEYKLAQIENGSLERENFMKEIETGATQIIDHIKSYDEEATRTEASFSPLNGMKYYEMLTRYISEDKKTQVKKIIGGRIISDPEVAQLLVDGKIGPFHNFRSKSGNSFSASIALDEKNKPVLRFLNEEEDLEKFDYGKAERIGHYYGDGSEVYRTETSYVSKSYIQKEKEENGGFRLSRYILGKEIDEKNILLMIRGERSELIKGFKSTKTKRLFDAFLEIDGEGKIVFSFPPRKKKEAKTS